MIREKWMIPDEYKDANIANLQEHLVALRAKAGASQEEIANLIGVSRQTYYGIETGKKNMSWTIYIALIFFFNKSNATRQMIKDLKIYPTDWIEKFNEAQ